MSTGRILVVTPTLGASPFLEETVASVADQPLDIVHVLSAPAAKQEELRARFPGMTVVEDAGRAGGIYGAINAALGRAGADWDWFTYINDDDLLLPGFGRASLRHLGAPTPAPVAYGDVELVDEGGRPLARITTERDPAWIPALLQQGISPLMQQGMLVRRDLVERLGGFDLRYRLCADLDFWLRAYAGGAAFRHHPERVARFRVRAGQLSGDTRLTQAEQDAIVARLLPVPVPPLKRKWAVVRYRACNLPRYLARARAMRGLRTSYQVLQSGGRTR